MSGRFEVQHKGPASGDAWSTIGDVKSEATGDSETEARFYLFRSEDLAVGPHQFRVRQVGQNGATLTTDPVRVQVEMKKALRLTPPAPNPVRSEAMVDFGTKDAHRVEVALYDVLGRRVRTLFEGRPPPGEMQTERLVARGLPAGTYFVRLTAGGKTQVRRLTVAR